MKVQHVLGLVASCVAVPVNAWAVTEISPFVSATYNYDSNIFRLDRGEIGPAPQRHDTTLTLSAGVAVNLKFSRQQVNVTVSRSDTQFDRYSTLDYSGRSNTLNWDWQLGNRLRGQFSVLDSVSQSSYTDFDFLTGATPIINNLVRRNRYALNGSWMLHPRWSLNAGVVVGRVRNDSDRFRGQSSDDEAVDLGLSYTTPRGTRLGTQIVARTVSFDRQFSRFSQVDTGYDQTDFNLTADWRISGKLNTRSRFGYVLREYPNLSERDFNGLSGRVAMDYSPTGKTLVTLNVYRELAGTELNNASFRLSTGSSLNAQWLIDQRFSLSGGVTYEAHDYQGDPGFATGAARRKEDFLTQSLSLVYTPRDYLNLSLTAVHGSRDSELVNNSFEFDSYFATVRADF